MKTAEGERLFLADATDPDKRTKLSNGPGTDSGPALSPDRRSMIYMHATAPGKGIPWVSGTDGSGARPLFQKLPTQCADGITRPAWNAKDPTQLVLACFVRKTTGLYLVNTDGKVLRTLFTASGEGVGVSDPAVSPDGTRVVFQGQRIPGIGTFVMAMAGEGKPVQLTSGADADPVWSPTAPGVVAYRHAITANSWAIVLVNADRAAVPCAGLVRSNELGGGKQCQVTDGSTLDQDPTWSPTGTRSPSSATSTRGPASSSLQPTGRAAPGRSGRAARAARTHRPGRLADADLVSGNGAADQPSELAGS